MTLLKIEQNSYGYDITVTAKQNKVVIDITGTTQWFIIGDIISGPLWSGQCSVAGLDPSVGQCKFTVASSLTADSGIYRGELEVFTTGQKVECDEIDVAIMPSVRGVWAVS